MTLSSKLFLRYPGMTCGITEQQCVWVSVEKEPDCDDCWVWGGVKLDEEIDTYLTDEIICPYCGCEIDDDFTECEGTIQCDECEKWFGYEKEYSVCYTTRKSKSGMINFAVER